jgi:mRNA-degrading endonuclease RelE of RelBE toxin-antitoxin system
MKFQIKWTEEAVEQYDKLKHAAAEAKKNRARKAKSKQSDQEGLFKQVAKTVKYLGDNPRHPSLETHEYDGLENPYDKKEKVWEAYAQNKTPGAYRVFWCYGPTRSKITIISITPHP